MTTVWWTVVAVACLALTIIVHEAAHAIVLRSLGIRVVEFGIGMFAPRLRFALPRSDVTVSVSPWLLGAYVRPDPAQEHQMRVLSYRDSTWYAGAGIVVNLVLGGALLAVIALFDGRTLHALITGACTALVWWFRRWFCSYVLPVLGVPILVWTVFMLAHGLGEPQGPVGAVDMVTTELMNVSPVHAISVLGALSVAIGVINILPLYPLDGGRIASAALQRLIGTRAADIFQDATVVLSLGLMVYAVASDVWWLI